MDKPSSFLVNALPIILIHFVGIVILLLIRLLAKRERFRKDFKSIRNFMDPGLFYEIFFLTYQELSLLIVLQINNLSNKNAFNIFSAILCFLALIYITVIIKGMIYIIEH